MVKTIRCADLGLACEHEIKAEGEDELLKRVAEHVQTVHAMNPEAPGMEEKFRGAMREE